MRHALRLALLTLAFGLGTHAFGWWSVPVIAAAWGGWAGDAGRPGLIAGTAAAVSWTIVVVWTGLTGPLPLLVEKLGAVTGLPGIVWIVATLLFPLALAWSAALVACSLVSAVRR